MSRNANVSNIMASSISRVTGLTVKKVNVEIQHLDLPVNKSFLWPENPCYMSFAYNEMCSEIRSLPRFLYVLHRQQFIAALRYGKSLS